MPQAPGMPCADHLAEVETILMAEDWPAPESATGTD